MAAAPRFPAIVLACAVAQTLSSSAQAQDYAGALSLQRSLALDTTLERTQWLGAHNAWNDSNAVWANQRWSLERLLQSGIRAIDLDLHRNSRGQVRLCHESCGTLISAEDDYEGELRKVRAFLDQNPREIVFLDLEDKVGNAGDVQGPLENVFGSMLYRPSDKPGDRWPTPREMIALGKRVIVKSANQTYGSSLIWDGRLFSVNASPGYNYRQVKYFDVARCTTDGWALEPGRIYGVMDSKIGKDLLPDSWVDETGTIDTSNIGGLLRCAVNFVDADRWDDDMVRASLWSFRAGEPNNANGNEHCAMMWAGQDGRWNDADCGNALRFACRAPGSPDAFLVTSSAGRWQEGPARCQAEFPGSQFAVPRNAFQNRALLAATGGSDVWLAFSDLGSEGRFEVTENVQSTMSSTGNTVQTLRAPGVATVRVRLQGDLNPGQTVYVYDLNRSLRYVLTGRTNAYGDMPENGAIIERTGGAGPALRVWLEPEPPSTTLEYRRLHNDTDRCLDLKNRSSEDGTVVHHWSCHGADSQLWAMDAQGLIHSKLDPSKCLDLRNGSFDEGTEVVLWPCHGGLNQRWAWGLSGTLRSHGQTQRTLDLKGAGSGSSNGQIAHLWGVHYGSSQRWRWD